MKIGILTHPLKANYGGILQALALKEFLEQLGHTVIILNRRPNTTICKVWLKNIVNVISNLFGIERTIKTPDADFISKNFHLSRRIYNHKQLVKTIDKNKIDAIVIGSDQVWNASFSKLRDLDYWGGFYTDCNVKIISYAASMGIPIWEYDDMSTTEIVKCLTKFSGISVREYHIIPILEKMGVNNIKWVLDPTLLVPSDFYYKFISTETVKKNPFIFIYWMGDESLIPKIPTQYSHCKIIKCNLSEPNGHLTIENWLTCIRNAELVITNSFHGCALSIAFKKHFIPYVNPNYIESRLISLFTMLGLNNKLLDPYSYEDYKEVYNVITTLRQESSLFLRKSLSD